jgi:hypothetical protein
VTFDAPRCASCGRHGCPVAVDDRNYCEPCGVAVLQRRRGEAERDLNVALGFLVEGGPYICSEILDPGSGRRTGPSVRDNNGTACGKCRPCRINALLDSPDHALDKAPYPHQYLAYRARWLKKGVDVA